jgi:hypothetical protein
VVGQQVLVLFTGVRIPIPEPRQNFHLIGWVFCCQDNFAEIYLRYHRMTKIKITLLSVFVIALQLSFVSSFAQTNPTNPGGGTTATPSISSGNSGTNQTNSPSGITPITPITPDINNEQIIDGTGTTTPDTKKAPAIVQPPTNQIQGQTQPTTPQVTQTNSQGNGQVSALQGETARTGGLVLLQ